ncbi:hypothetical protein METP1_03478 [Methanosarcinales archaeon]|nr:hypothetical protein METP1_03478 [Methanosarcinales archaeon]
MKEGALHEQLPGGWVWTAEKLGIWIKVCPILPA